MITLYQFASVWGLPNPSPFCFKVENYLRMTDLPFEIRSGDVRKAPKGKLPYIDEDGTIVADSTHIIEHLKRKHGDKLDADLSDQQRAMAHLIRRTLEEGYYWYVVTWRWADDAGFELANRDLLRPNLPPILRSVLPGVIRKGVVKQLRAQGTGRHTRAEIEEGAEADLTALSTLLGDQPFFLGDAPTSIDASAYAFLALSLWAPPPGKLEAMMKKRPNLVAYCERMKARYYPK